ncbi:MAG: hypothetical protein BGO78_01960 [Chloroflexi bacterium 44-23]|nr:MAG: hypothetical protein BGO78_01960 [Chloroflexi bacterium 44-23]
MSRVINPESSGKERTQKAKGIVKAIRELMTQTEPNQLSKDLAAYIAISLNDIYETIDVSVVAWEKRGYWLKADRFRLDWEWTEQFARQMKEFVLKEDWAGVALLSTKIAQKFQNVQITAKNRIGEPWVGAWKKLRQ